MPCAMHCWKSGRVWRCVKRLKASVDITHFESCRYGLMKPLSRKVKVKIAAGAFSLICIILVCGAFYFGYFSYVPGGAVSRSYQDKPALNAEVFSKSVDVFPTPEETE